jgi:hypothetical protein
MKHPFGAEKLPEGDAQTTCTQTFLPGGQFGEEQAG